MTPRSSAGQRPPGFWADPARPFHWQDGERTILFGRGMLARAAELLEPGYTLLSTPRGLACARELTGGEELAGGAVQIHEVASGRVDELAARLRSTVRGELLVALGGGRVIDVAKSLAAADPPRRVAAIPTTLSGAEMTSIHRHAAGVESSTPRVRPALIINDGTLSASQPAEALARSAANAVGHVADGIVTPLANPVATIAGMEAARLIASALGLSSGQALEQKRDPDALALGALLAGYVIGGCGYGLHHVLAQTLARFAGVSHGAANAVMLSHSLAALKRRFPAVIERLTGPLGSDPPAVAARLSALGGATHLRELGVSQAALDHCVEEAATRAELHMTPPAADPPELRALYEAAY
ncbi:MAG: iron-containing alcohol dehydrogenase [Solirubrobacteraceae bacterium]